MVVRCFKGVMKFGLAHEFYQVNLQFSNVTNFKYSAYVLTSDGRSKTEIR